MTSPMFLRTNPRRKRQPENGNINYKDSPSFQDAIDSEDEEAINTILSDDESHMTPASLPHTTYQLFATNLRMLPSGIVIIQPYLSILFIKRGPREVIISENLWDNR